MASIAPARPAEALERKCAERDALSDWLAALEQGPSPDPAAVAIVRAQLERVVQAIARIRGSAD